VEGAADIGQPRVPLWLDGRKMARQELETGLCELGNRIWEAIQSDDAIADTLFKLVDMKLALDNVTLDDSCLDRDAAKAILTDVEDDATNLVRPKKFAPQANGRSLLYTILRWIGLLTRRRSCG
jgi:hypothetical protein